MKQTYQYQTFLTANEWYNVDFSKNLRNFNNNIFYPYIEEIILYWYIFLKSIQIASKYDSLYNIIFSSYTIMNLFIGITNTIECLFKQITSIFLLLPIDPDLKNLINNYHEEYYNFIQKEPFFKFDFYHYFKILIANFIPFCFSPYYYIFLIEIILKGILSKFVNLFDNSVINYVQLEFKYDINTFNILTEFKTYIIGFDLQDKMRVNFKRYNNFQEMLIKLSEYTNDIHIISINGHKIIQIDLYNNLNDNNQKYGNFLYKYRNISCYEVNVNNLLFFVNTNKQFIKKIHDF